MGGLEMLYNSNDIQKIIPHRYPFLLVDCIESISEDGKTIVGRKCVTANEMQFLGHFPEKHVMPGVLIIEALAQTGCVLLLSKEENKGKIAFFAGINKARFRKQVIPGDVLTMTVTLTKEKGGIYFAAIEAKVEDEIAVTGEIMCAVGE
jgi:3-hydroxyacyl-[acyl-carrier-protein] dehydratase